MGAGLPIRVQKTVLHKKFFAEGFVPQRWRFMIKASAKERSVPVTKGQSPSAPVQNKFHRLDLNQGVLKNATSKKTTYP